MKSLMMFFYRAVRPHFWVRLHPTCWRWDKKLNEAMDKGVEAKRENKFTVNLGRVCIWVRNYPSAYGRCEEPEYAYLPAPWTQKRLRNYLYEHAEQPPEIL